MTRPIVLDAPPEHAIVKPPANAAPRDILGLDLGQSQDYTALSLVERVLEPTGKFVDSGEKQLMQRDYEAPVMVPVIAPQLRARLNVTDLGRFPLNTDYVLMGQTVAAAVRTIGGGAHKPVLVIDHTGVGRGVFDIFRALRLGIPLLGVTITGGQQAQQDKDRPWEWTVPKKDLVSALQVVVQNDRLRVAPKLALAEVFTKEMQSFRMEIKSSGRVTYEAWREGEHDDLVLSVALACWVAQMMDRGRMQ
jgi:hypothetical protein